MRRIRMLISVSMCRIYLATLIEINALISVIKIIKSFSLYMIKQYIHKKKQLIHFHLV